MKKTIAIVLACAFVAGCNSDDGNSAAPAKPLTKEEMAAKAKEVFKRDPGMWKESAQLVDIDVSGTGEPDKEKQVEDMMKQMASIAATPKENCVTPEQADQGVKKMIDGMGEADCTTNKFTSDGGVVDMAMACKSKDGSVANLTIKGTFTTTKVDSTMTVDAAAPTGKGKMVMTMKNSGERIGDCK